MSSYELAELSHGSEILALMKVRLECSAFIVCV